VFTLLLIIHLIGVCGWLGGAVYERLFIVGGIRRAKGTDQEAHLVELMLSTVPFFLTSVLLILITGISMAVLADYRFFGWDWLGLKQYVMVAILLGFVSYIGPTMGKIGKQVKSRLAEGKQVTDETRDLIRRVTILLDVVHLGVLLNLVLGVAKFF
jgi:uncharacterized membrane protein